MSRALYWFLRSGGGSGVVNLIMMGGWADVNQLLTGGGGGVKKPRFYVNVICTRPLHLLTASRVRVTRSRSPTPPRSRSPVIEELYERVQSLTRRSSSPTQVTLSQLDQVTSHQAADKLSSPEKNPASPLESSRKSSLTSNKGSSNLFDFFALFMACRIEP